MPSSRSEKMELALQTVVKRIVANLASPPVPSFEHNGQEHSLATSSIERFAHDWNVVLTKV